MKTTNTLNILVLLLSILLFVGCEKEVDDKRLRVTPEIIEIDYEGGIVQVDIESTSGWEVVVPSDCTWVKSDRYESEIGHRQWIKLTILRNKSESIRKATITISNRVQRQDITITQSAPSFSVTPESIDVGADKTTKDITINSNISWAAKKSDSWISLSKGSDDAGNSKITVTIAKNTFGYSRSGYIEIYNTEYNIFKIVDINQNASSPELSVSPNSFNVGEITTTKTVTIESNIPWTAKTSKSWIHVSKLSGSVGTTTLTIDIHANTSTSSRSGYIEIYNTECNISKTITVTQSKGAGSFIECAEGLNMKMILIEGGTFAMGSTSGDDDEKPVHNVTLDSYYIGETEITQAQWRAVMGSNPSEYTGDNHPVEYVSWEDAQEFCDKLSALTGKKYVLPTEAQWEYAARGGNKSKGYTYSGSNNVDDVAVYLDNKTNQDSNVKSKKPNELGIYDMSGNVCEWCSDWYSSSYYYLSPLTNPQGPSSGNYRVWRGGSRGSISFGCRVALRGDDYPSIRLSIYGFRVVYLP